MVSFCLNALASTLPTDAGVDLGIGVVGLRVESAKPQTTVRGLWPNRTAYSAKVQQALAQVVLRRQPYPTHPVVGKIAFDENGLLGIQQSDGFYPLRDQGIPLGDNTYGWFARQRQGRWVEVTIAHVPLTTGWMQLDAKSPFAFWLWYHYFAPLVAAKVPLHFITPVHDDLRYQPNERALAAFKNAFELEDAVLIPEKLEGPYMLIRTGKSKTCPGQATAHFENLPPQRGWIRWLSDEGRPRIFRYFPQACP